ncbi:hypothetical protein LOT_2268 [Lentilactobacillus otakiensis DSM 19908 = JCM 15040]|uniref:Uncharacterized protein n=1 Tax=Lentilactobacillus otakiensis DSM 19908 = JCM 15040 TaxID=1423780 RepID=S4PR24_9LACO|nr:hypothetical protein LOT_2268 [Lentilactobacillus otakiensis DSM 19908 = JCM 15040]
MVIVKLAAAMTTALSNLFIRILLKVAGQKMNHFDRVS